MYNTHCSFCWCFNQRYAFFDLHFLRIYYQFVILIIFSIFSVRSAIWTPRNCFIVSVRILVQTSTKTNSHKSKIMKQSLGVQIAFLTIDLHCPKSDMNTTDPSHQIWLMGATFEWRMNQSVPKTCEMHLWCSYLILDIKIYIAY